MRRSIYYTLVTVTAFFLLGGTAFGGGIVLTPFGQSPDGMMIRVVLKKIGYKARLKKTLSAESLGNPKVLIVAVGGSSKGMGAAGFDKESEMSRVKELFRIAKTKRVKILVMHIGGKGRRGKLTDQFLKTAVPVADRVIIVESGNADGLFTNLLKGKNVELLTAKSIRKTSVPLKKTLSEWGIKANRRAKKKLSYFEKQALSEWR